MSVQYNFEEDTIKQLEATLCTSKNGTGMRNSTISIHNYIGGMRKGKN
jgi:hypothetical protein